MKVFPGGVAIRRPVPFPYVRAALRERDMKKEFEEKADKGCLAVSGAGKNVHFADLDCRSAFEDPGSPVRKAPS